MDGCEKSGVTRILVVDDDEDLLCLLKDALHAQGYVVDLATNGIAALERLKSAHFDLLLTDINMPGMNGIELLEKINAESIPVRPVIMSSMFSNRLRCDARERGALVCLDKPFSLGSLFSVIENSFLCHGLNSSNPVNLSGGQCRCPEGAALKQQDIDPLPAAVSGMTKGGIG